MAIDPVIIEALTPLVLAIAGLVLQYIKSKDTDKHGDAFISMLKKDGETFEAIAQVIPAIEPYVIQYKAIVNEADKIWNSGGFTADDIKLIQQQYTWWKMQFDLILSKYRTVKTALATPATTNPQ